MVVFEPLRRSAEGFIDTISEGWDWLRERGGAALTRFRPSRETADSAPPELWGRDGWGLLAADLAETDDELIVRLEAPGLEEKDFSVSVVSGHLLLRGEKRYEHSDRNAHYHLFESAYGAFERAIALPCEVDADRAKASYRNGVLTVHLPRTEASKRRQIQVEAG